MNRYHRCHIESLTLKDLAHVILPKISAGVVCLSVKGVFVGTNNRGVFMRIKGPC